MDFARLALETRISDGRIEILEARGDAWKDDGVLLVRITAEGTAGHYESKTTTVTRCYRYAVTNYGDVEPDVVEIPIKPAAKSAAPPIGRGQRTSRPVRRAGRAGTRR